MVTGVRDIRLNIGATVATNDGQNWLRNPYAHTVTAKVSQEAPVQHVQPLDIMRTEFAGVHRSSLYFKSGGVTSRKGGLMFMPKRGRYFFKAVSPLPFKTSTLRNASLDFLPHLPTGTMDGEGVANNMRGHKNPQIVARAGTYTNEEIAAWIGATGWNYEAIVTQNGLMQSSGEVDAETAIMLNGDSNGGDFNVSVELYDLGDWSPEWIGGVR